MRNASGHQCKVKMSGVKNSEREQVRHFLDKTCNLGVYLQSCTTTAKKCTNKCAARARLLFLLIRPTVVFSPFSLP